MAAVREIEAKRILTRQKRGFLTEGPYPFTHTLSWAVGCGFGGTYCGQYCYARMLPNWNYNREEDEDWGDAVVIKSNAPALLDAELRKSRTRQTMRIFMSSVTDPYQPLEKRFRLTRQCLQVFVQYDDLDLLVIQTRGPSVVDDLDLIASIPYAWLSMTIETDRNDLGYGPGKAWIDKRFDAVRQAADAGVSVQITVSPCLPYSAEFPARLANSGAQRVVVDTFVDGDGSQGARTAESPFAQSADYNWRETSLAQQLYDDLQRYPITVGWSADGFGNVPPRSTHSSKATLL